MKRGLPALTLALVLSLGLTSCAMGDKNADAGSGSTPQSGSAAGDVREDVDDVRDELTDDMDDDMVGNAAPETNDNSNTQARRSAYDYLEDGKYRADETGTIIPRQSQMGLDMTRGVRELLEDARKMSEEMRKNGGNIDAP